MATATLETPTTSTFSHSSNQDHSKTHPLAITNPQIPNPQPSSLSNPTTTTAQKTSYSQSLDIERTNNNSILVKKKMKLTTPLISAFNAWTW